MRTGSSVARMNEELESVGLLSNGPETVDDFEKNYAGFLGELANRPVRNAAGLSVVTFGIHTGSSCGFDDTVVLYQGKPLRRIATINASSQHGYRVREVSVGRSDPGRGRIIGSAWVLSNCTSNWNGEAFRIDLLQGRSIATVLERPLGASSAYPVEISIEDDIVTFRYTTAIGDLVSLTRTGIARYRVQGGHAIRQAPVAASYGGFIDEWLGMDDAEAARWSAPEAKAQHHDLAARKELLQWEHVAACPGLPPVREIAVRWSKSGQTSVFLISGSSPAEMRMLSVSDKRSPSCKEIDISRDLASILSDPSP